MSENTEEFSDNNSDYLNTEDVVEINNDCDIENIMKKNNNNNIKLANDDERLSKKGVYANVDFYSGILYKEMGIPVDLFTTIFATSRISGWLAHWVEQVNNNKIFRPTQNYKGYKARDYKDISSR